MKKRVKWFKMTFSALFALGLIFQVPSKKAKADDLMTSYRYTKTLSAGALSSLNNLAGLFGVTMTSPNVIGYVYNAPYVIEINNLMYYYESMSISIMGNYAPNTTTIYYSYELIFGSDDDSTLLEINLEPIFFGSTISGYNITWIGSLSAALYGQYYVNYLLYYLSQQSVLVRSIDQYGFAYRKANANNMSTSYKEGYSVGESDGKNRVINSPNTYGLYSGGDYEEHGQIEYQRGFDVGSGQVPGYSSVLSSIFGAAAKIFNLEIFPHITIAMILGIPILLSLILVIVKMIRG